MIRIITIGAGPGSALLLTAQACRALAGCELVFCTDRLHGLAAEFAKKDAVRSYGAFMDLVHGIKHEVTSAQELIASGALSHKTIGVLVSGDPTFHSMLGLLKKSYPDCEHYVVPGIGSLDYLIARAGVLHDGAQKISLHATDDPEYQLLTAVRTSEYVATLLDEKNDGLMVAQTLAAHGFECAMIWIGENLSYPDERIVSGSPQEILKTYEPASDLVAAFVYNPQASIAAPAQPAPEGKVPTQTTAACTHDLRFGLGLDEWVRADRVPLTKAEVRALCLSKLELTDDAVIWDLGAGSGSVGIEALRMARRAHVYAVEHTDAAIPVIEMNAEQLGVRDRLEILHADIANILDELPEPTHIFVGGSKGTLELIAQKAASFNRPIRLVFTAITLQTAATVERLLNQEPFSDYESIMVSVSRSRKLGSSLLWASENPIIIQSGWVNRHA